MDELLFCNNCGKVRMSSVNKIGDKCLTCETGTFIGTGIDYDMVYAEVIEEYKEAHNGDYPSLKVTNEMIRKKYFYGKLDGSSNSAAVGKREYSESPEGIEEQNQQTRKWMRSQQNGNVGVPKCPTCGSTNIRKISTGERMVSVGMLGLFSKKINKSFKCNSCGYTW